MDTGGCTVTAAESSGVANSGAVNELVVAAVAMLTGWMVVVVCQWRRRR